jgi:predicted ribosome-associated RNA-binding protein Tma20
MNDRKQERIHVYKRTDFLTCVVVVSRLAFVSLDSATPFIMLCRFSRSKNKGVGAEILHYLGDGLFQTAEI